MKTTYSPPKMDVWQGRTDAKPDEYFYQIAKPLDLTGEIAPVHRKIALLGFACDTGVVRNLGRKGAAKGPEILKKALARLPVHHRMEIYDAGEIECKDDGLETAQKALSAAVAKLLQAHYFPLILGGGHEAAWGHYMGLHHHFNAPIPVLNLDAHFDLRDLLEEEKGSSGTAMHQIAKMTEKFDYSCIGIQQYSNTKALFERAKKLGVSYLLAEEIHLGGVQRVANFTEALLKRVKNLYLTFCLDLISSAYLPAVSAPQPLGLTPWQIIPCLRQLASSGKLVGFDLVEFAPCYDENGNSAKLGGTFLSEFIHEFK